MKHIIKKAGPSDGTKSNGYLPLHFRKALCLYGGPLLTFCTCVPPNLLECFTHIDMLPLCFLFHFS